MAVRVEQQMRGSLKPHWNLLVSYLKPQWCGAVALAALILGNIGLQLVSPQIVRHFIDIAGGGAAPQRLTAAALLFLGTAIAGQALSIAATYLGENLAWKATNALRHDLVLHCLRAGESQQIRRQHLFPQGQHAVCDSIHSLGA